MLRAIIAVVIASAAAVAPAQAQTWPARPITLVVPFAAGGPVDTIARILAARMSETLKQQIIIENIGGAGGMTGSARVAKAPPDGYTLLMSGSAVLAINQTLYRRPLYNVLTDFEHVVLHSDSARVLVVRPDFPAKNLPEFVAYAKANHAKMQYGSAGAGSGGHVCTILLEGAMGTKITHVPYRGAGPAMQDLIAGRIDFMAEQISTALPQVQGGKLKALATFGLDRAPGLEACRPPTSRGSRASIAAPGARSRSRRARPTPSCSGSRKATNEARGVAAGARPLQAARRRDPGGGAAHGRIFPQVRASPRSSAGPLRSRRAAS